MNSIKGRYRTIILLLFAFILGGFLHIALYGKKYATCIVQIYYGAVVVLWAMSIQLRIIYKRVRVCLLLIASMLILYFILQVEKYNLIRDNVVLMRNVWYWYYVPMIWIPLLFYIISQCIYTINVKIMNILTIAFMLIGLVLSFCFITNDFHMKAFVITNMEMPEKGYGYGPVYTFFVVYMFLLYTASIVNIIRKNQLISIKRLSWLPLIISIAGAIGIIIAEATDALSINNIRIWNLPEWYAFIVIEILESCILIGLIPSNTGYMSLVKSMSVPVEFREKNGKKVLSSDFNYIDQSHMQVNTFQIHGGEMTWAADMSKLHVINEQLEIATEQLQNRNNYLQTENKTKEEQETLNSRNRVYDKITEIVLPQLIEVERLLNDDLPDNVDKNLPYVAVLNTYIKRRCNMELIREDMDNLPLSELKLAMNESASYLQLCNIQTVIAGSEKGEYPADDIICAYEFFESVIEKGINKFSSIMAIISEARESFTLKIMADDEPVNEFVAKKEDKNDSSFS